MDHRIIFFIQFSIWNLTYCISSVNGAGGVAKNGGFTLWRFVQILVLLKYRYFWPNQIPDNLMCIKLKYEAKLKNLKKVLKFSQKSLAIIVILTILDKKNFLGKKVFPRKRVFSFSFWFISTSGQFVSTLYV